MEIIWTESAKKDLYSVFKFLISDISEEKALQIINQIIDKTEILKEMPFTGQKEPKFEKLHNEYRRLIENHYKIVYHVKNKTVFINRIFDSRQNPNKLFV